MVLQIECMTRPLARNFSVFLKQQQHTWDNSDIKVVIKLALIETPDVKRKWRECVAFRNSDWWCNTFLDIK